MVRVLRGEESALGISRECPASVKKVPNHTFWKTSSLEDGGSPDIKCYYSCQVGEGASFITAEVLRAGTGNALTRATLLVTLVRSLALQVTIVHRHSKEGRGEEDY